MRVLHFFSLLVAVFLAVFAVLNWSVLLTPAELSLGVADIQAPLGLMLLAALVIVVTLAMLYVLVQQTVMMRELRHSERELRAQRELADKAEASRFSELQQHLGRLQAQWLERMDSVHASVLAGQTDSVQRLTQRLDQDGRSLAAQLGEIEDKLDRRLGLPLGGQALDDGSS